MVWERVDGSARERWKREMGEREREKRERERERERERGKEVTRVLIHHLCTVQKLQIYIGKGRERKRKGGERERERREKLSKTVRLLGGEFLSSLLRDDLCLKLDIEISGVLVVSSDINRSFEGIVVVDNGVVIEVKDSLLPVGILSTRTGREGNLTVGTGELDVEVSKEGMAILILLKLNLKLGVKVKLFLGDGENIDIEDLARVGDHLFRVTNINKRLHESKLLDTSHIKSIHVVPEVNLILAVLGILDTADEDLSLIGEDETVLHKPLVSGVEDSVEHRLVEEEVTHPLGDDDVNLVDGEGDVLDLAADEGDLCGCGGWVIGGEDVSVCRYVCGLWGEEREKRNDREGERNNGEINKQTKKERPQQREYKREWKYNTYCRRIRCP